MKIGYTIWPWMLQLDESTQFISMDAAAARAGYVSGLKEISHLGYQTVETFSRIVDLFDNESEEFDALNKRYHLDFQCLYCHLTDDFDEDLKLMDRCCRFMKKNGIKYMNLQAPMRSKEREVMEEDVKLVAKKANIIGKMVGNADGILCMHQHLNSIVESENELEIFAAESDCSLVKFCFDTAHIALANMNLIEAFKKYMDRIIYVHLKDVAAKWEPDPFARFRPLGQGILDLKGVYDTLEENGFDGTLCVEMDKPKLGNYEAASFSRSYIRSVFGL